MIGDNLENVFMEYVDFNSNYIKKIVTELEKLRPKEEASRDFKMALNQLKKTISEVGFDKFQSQLEDLVNDVLNFDTNNIEYNIQKVNDYIDFLNHNKNLYLDISESFSLIQSSWDKFVFRFSSIKDSVFAHDFHEKIASIENDFKNLSSSELGEISFAISDLQKSIDSIIEKISNLEQYKTLHVFIGDEANSVLNDIKELLKCNMSFTEFNKKYNEVMDRIEEISLKSRTCVISLPVVKITSDNVFMKTLSINENIIKYNSFFLHEDLKTEKTDNVLFLEGFPDDGIFHGKTIVNEFSLYDNHLQFLQYTEDLISKYHIVLLLLFFLMSIGTFFMDSIFTILLFASFPLIFYIFGYKPIKNLLINNARRKFNVPKALFNLTNVNIKDIIVNIISDFDHYFTTEVKDKYKFNG